MGTQAQIDAWKDLAIVEALYHEQLLGSEYVRVWCAKRAARSSFVGRRATRVRRLLAAAHRRRRVADRRAAVVGAIVRHVFTLERGEALS